LSSLSLFLRVSSAEPSVHLHLHSFPTRRSSDLARIFVRSLPVRAEEDLRAADYPGVERLWLLALPRVPLARFSRARAAPGATGRSEEHTSELQSPDHLVCRLLLEKKKPYLVLTT